MEQAFRRGEWMYGEARCRRVDVEVWRYAALEARCSCVDVEASRYGAVSGREGGCVVIPKSFRF